jgi:hypothetical protein
VDILNLNPQFRHLYNPEEISKLSKDQIEGFIRDPGSKSRRLLKAYQCALDPSKWERDGEQTIESEAEVGDDDGDETKDLRKDKKRKRDSDPLGNERSAEGNYSKLRAVVNPRDNRYADGGQSKRTPAPATQALQIHNDTAGMVLCRSRLHLDAGSSGS